MWVMTRRDCIRRCRPKQPNCAFEEMGSAALTLDNYQSSARASLYACWVWLGRIAMVRGLPPQRKVAFKERCWGGGRIIYLHSECSIWPLWVLAMSGKGCTRKCRRKQLKMAFSEIDSGGSNIT